MQKKKRQCDIPGCTRTSRVTFAHKSQCSRSIRVCRHCLARHNSNDMSFSIWEQIKVPIIPGTRISGKSPSLLSAGSSAGKKKRRGREARRTLQQQLEERRKDCKHQYRIVRWDKIYSVARCLQCGIQVKRLKGTDKYKTKKKTKKLPRDLLRIEGATIEVAMMMFFFQNGIVDTQWKDAIKIARAVRPGTKFNNASFSWYRNLFVSRYILRKDSKMGRGDKKNRRKDKKGKKTKKGKKSTRRGAVKKTTTSKKKKKTIQSIVLDYFDQVGVDDAKYEKTKARVLKAHPDSAFNKTHMGWYRAKWHEEND